MRAVIQNVFGIRSADIDIEGIVLVAGQNRAGKTSVLEAIACAAIGDATPGATKASAAQLLYEGAAQGAVMIGDDQNWIRWSLPSAEISSAGERPALSRIATGLEGTSLLDLDQGKRAKALIDALKVRVLRGPIFSDLRDMGIPEDPRAKALRDEGKSEGYIGDVLSEDGEAWQQDEFGRIVAEISKNGPGWDDSALRHETRATELKGAWRKETDGGTWGTNKAMAWKPEGWLPRLDFMKPGTAQAAADAAQAAYTDALVKSGGGTSADAMRQERQRLAALWPARHDQHEAAIKASAEKQNAVAHARAARDKLPVPTDEQQTLACPCCGKALRYLPAIGVKAAELATATTALPAEEIRQQRLARAGADGELSKAEAELAKANQTLALARVERDQALGAKEWLAANPADGDAAKATLAAQRVENALASLSMAQTDLRMLKSRDEAMVIHQQIEREIRLAKWMAPSGIRARLLHETVSLYNSSVLAPLCDTAGWLPVEILEVDGGFQFAYGGRWRRLSESEKFRVRAVLELAIAQRDGSAFAIIDGADILTPKASDGRAGLFKLAMSMPFPVLIGMTVALGEAVIDLAGKGQGRTYLVTAGVVAPLGSGATT